MPGPDGNGVATSAMADDIRAHQFDVLRVDAGLRNQILKILGGVETEMVEALARIDPTDPVREATKFKRMQAVLDETRGKTNSIYRQARDTELRTSEQLAGIETDFMNGSMKEGLDRIDVKYSAVSFSDEFLDALGIAATVDGSPSNRWWAQQAGDTQFRFQQEMTKGIVAGDTLSQMVVRVRGGTRDGVQVKGLMDTSYRNAEALVRTKVQAVANDAHLAVFRRNPDIVEAVGHVSTLDNKTTQQCIVRDGLEWTLDGEPIGHSVPFDPAPVHWGCRSAMVPIVKGATKVTGERASATGPVPASENFEEYMTRRGKKFQNEVLGPTRAQLWRDGKIEMKDLLDFKGDPLTLDQLAARVPGEVAVRPTKPLPLPFGPAPKAPSARVMDLVGSDGTHFTSTANGRTIAKKGFDFDKSGPSTWEGAGLYMFPGDIPQQGNFGKTKIFITHKARKPFVGNTASVEKRVTVLRNKLVPPFAKTPDGDKIPDGAGGFVRAWQPDFTENMALRRAWIADGFDSVYDTETGVFALFDERALLDLRVSTD